MSAPRPVRGVVAVPSDEFIGDAMRSASARAERMAREAAKQEDHRIVGSPVLYVNAGVDGLDYDHTITVLCFEWETEPGQETEPF